MPGERARPFVEVEVGITQREVDPLRRQALRMRDHRGQCGEVAVTVGGIGGEALAVVVLFRIAADDGNAAHRHLPSGGRSEEHTSELQALMRHSYAVLYLQKKTKPEDRIPTNNH